MNNFILVHPNNTLTQIDSLTIPNVQKHKLSLESQIDEVEKILNDYYTVDNCPESKYLAVSNVNKKNLPKLLKYKQSEYDYVSSYLNVLESLESVCKNCHLKGNDYDYEKEDEILNKIEEEMKNFKSLEKELAKNKSDWESSVGVTVTPLNKDENSNQIENIITGKVHDIQI